MLHYWRSSSLKFFPPQPNLHHYFDISADDVSANPFRMSLVSNAGLQPTLTVARSHIDNVLSL
jgi:hypothetical protein